MSINSLDKSSNQKINNQQVEQQNVNTKVNTSSNVISKKIFSFFDSVIPRIE